MLRTDYAEFEKILIVEDEFIIAQDLQALLEENDFTVTGIAPTYERAVDLLREHRPDLVLLDIRLRGDATGIELAGLLQQSYQIPFLFITSHADKGTLVQAHQNNPLGYVIKPYEGQDIVNALKIASVNHVQRMTAHLEQRKTQDRRFLQAGLRDALANTSSLAEFTVTFASHLNEIIPHNLMVFCMEPLTKNAVLLNQCAEKEADSFTTRSLAMLVDLPETVLNQHLKMACERARRARVLSGPHFQQAGEQDAWLAMTRSALNMKSVISIPIDISPTCVLHLYLFSHLSFIFSESDIDLLLELMPFVALIWERLYRLEEQDVSPFINADGSENATALETIERQHIARILRHTRGKVRGKDGAASLLDMPPTTLESRMAKLGIKKDAFK